MTPDKALQVGIRMLTYCEEGNGDERAAATTLAALRPVVADFLHWWPMLREVFDDDPMLRDPFQEALEHLDAAYAVLAPEGGQT